MVGAGGAEPPGPRMKPGLSQSVNKARAYRATDADLSE
jgi:hypothetical protein